MAAWWVLVAVASVGLALLGLWRERLRWRALGKASESHFFSTRDGWEVALHRYPAKRRRFSVPVILFHGMGSNERGWSLGGVAGWVGQLHRAGYDVWTCSWRGEGRSRPRFADVRYAWGWPVQAWIEEDLPALWGGVLRVTGSPKVHCVGHGLGGRLLFEALKVRANPTVLTCTLLGVGKAPKIPASRWFGRMEWLFFWPYFPWSGLAIGLRVILWAVCRLRGWKWGFAETRSPNIALMRRWLLAGTEPISGPLLRQWLLWQGKSRGFLGEMEEQGSRAIGLVDGDANSDGKEMASQARWLFVVGDRDLIAPLESVERLLGELRGGQKQAICLPLNDSIHAMHYSHLDLLLSPALQDDFFPLWLRWLEDPEGVSLNEK